MSSEPVNEHENFEVLSCGGLNMFPQRAHIGGLVFKVTYSYYLGVEPLVDN